MHKLYLCLIFLVVCCVLPAFKKQHKITLWMIGDSTMSVKKEQAYPETGWGMPFSGFFNQHVIVRNRAVNGRSTLSFLAENRWQEVYDSLKPRDYVIIEFGHNDEKLQKAGVGVTPEQYTVNLARFVLEARSRKAFPILMTPIARCSFEEGKLTDTHGRYPEAVRRLADSLAVPMVDMLVRTQQMLTEFGEQGAVGLFNNVDSGHVNYPQGKKDNTHLNPVGALAVAHCAMQGLKDIRSPLAKYFKPGP